MWSKPRETLLRPICTILLAAASASLLSCDECKTSKDCSIGQVCMDGTCKSSLVENPDTGSDTGPFVYDTDTGTGYTKPPVKDAGPDAADTDTLGGPCENVSDCKDDNNPCTIIQCVSELCIYLAQSNIACDSGGDYCTPGMCVNGECVGKPRPDGVDCDDGLWCNGFETCQSGVCVARAESIPCTMGNPCRQLSCTEPLAPGEDGICGEGDLILSPDGQSCENDLFCDGLNTCQSGTCASGLNPCKDLESSKCTEVRCDDTNDKCELSFENMQGVSCANSYLCDGEEKCRDGACRPGIAYCENHNTCIKFGCSENDGNPTCDTDTEYEVNGTACTPANPCTGSGDHFCLAGICSYGTLPPANADTDTSKSCALYGDGDFCSVHFMCDEDQGLAQCIGEADRCASGFTAPMLGEATDAGAGEIQPARSIDTTLTYNETTSYNGTTCPGTFSGGEQVFEVITEAATSYTVELLVSAQTGEMEEMKVLLITDPGNPAGCQAMSTFVADTDSGSITLVFDGAATKQYLVVDGLNGCRAKGTIRLSRTPPS